MQYYKRISTQGNKCMHTQLSVSNSEIPWTLAHQALLSMGFSQQEYWSGLPFPSPKEIISFSIWEKYTVPQILRTHDVLTKRTQKYEELNFGIKKMNFKKNDLEKR